MAWCAAPRVCALPLCAATDHSQRQFACSGDQGQLCSLHEQECAVGAAGAAAGSSNTASNGVCVAVAPACRGKIVWPQVELMPMHVVQGLQQQLSLMQHMNGQQTLPTANSRRRLLHAALEGTASSARRQLQQLSPPSPVATGAVPADLTVVCPPRRCSCVHIYMHMCEGLPVARAAVHACRREAHSRQVYVLIWAAGRHRHSWGICHVAALQPCRAPPQHVF